MEYLASGILDSYGTDLVLIHGGESYDVRAFFRPVQSKSWSYLEGEYSPLGEIPRGQYICVLPADLAVQAGCTVWVEEKAYEIRRAEPVRAGNTAVYSWCLCVEKGGEDLW